jgi:hypothetical protein
MNGTVNRQTLLFLIYDSCFRFASYFRMDASTVICHSCNCNKVQSMPITGDQINKYDYDFILYNTEIPFRFVEWNDKK